jgi:hypothetical protein
MNPLIVETSLRTAFAASAFPTTQIYTGTGYDELTPESLNLIISCEQLDHSAGGLYRAKITVKVTAPALLGASSKSDMVTALNGVRSALEASYLSANWPTGSGSPGFGGVWIVGTKTSQDAHTWVAEVEATVGVIEI